MWNAGLDEAQAGIKIAGRNINNLRYADDSTLMAGSEEELKSFLMKVKKESEKYGLLTNQRSWYPVPTLYGRYMGKKWKQWKTMFSWAPKWLQMVTAGRKLKDAHFLEEKLWQT